MKFAVTLTIILVFTQAAQALPKFSTTQGKTCKSCHLNLAGGGLRTAEGIKYGQEVLPVKPWQQEFRLPGLTNKISENIIIGADVETLYKRTDSGDNEINDVAESLQLYRADFYFGLELAKNVYAYADFALDEKHEIFGLVEIPSLYTSIKVGKFIPEYGLKLEDEYSFVRSRLDLSREDGNPASPGVQVNFSAAGWNLCGAIFNGPLKGVGTEYAGKIEKYFSPMDNLNLLFGANIMYRNEFKSTTYGGYASVGFNNFSVIGETDIISTSGVKGMVSHLEGSLLITSGLEAFVSYNYYDQDMILTTGTLSRYNFGVEFYPMQGVKIKPSFGILKNSEQENNGNEVRVLVHLYF